MAKSGNGNLVLSDMVLKAAKAVNYTKAKVNKGAVNKGGDFFRSPLSLLSCTSKTHGAIDNELAGMAASGKIRSYWGDQLDVNAKWTKLNGCGNCNEQSAVAFVYLRDVLKVRPLDWMAYSTGDLVGSHAFVVVGRTEGTPMADSSSITPADMKSWNTSAVMCDAYEGEVYSYPDMVALLQVKGDLVLRHRVV